MENGVKLNTVWMFGLVIATSVVASYVFTTWVPPPPRNFDNPDYDSGWIATINYPLRQDFREVELNHNLGTNDISVYYYGKEIYESGDGEVWTNYSQNGLGEIHWFTSESNTFPEGKNRIVFNVPLIYNELRVLIWKLP